MIWLHSFCSDQILIQPMHCYGAAVFLWFKALLEWPPYELVKPIDQRWSEILYQYLYADPRIQPYTTNHSVSLTNIQSCALELNSYTRKVGKILINNEKYNYEVKSGNTVENFTGLSTIWDLHNILQCAARTLLTPASLNKGVGLVKMLKCTATLSSPGLA